MLEIINVSFSYGSINAIKGVSLSVGEGEMVTLIGANGAGKTTILSLISGLITPSAGEIVFRGQNITGMSPDKIVASGLLHVPEGRQIFARMTIEENLRLGAYLVSDKSLYHERLERAFEYFPLLRERRRQSAGTLSGGEQQMLAIARALVGGPKLLLLDEPSLGLSPLMTQQMFEVIQRLKQDGVTMLLVEQNAYEALSVSDRAYVLETGLISIEGNSRDLMGNDDIKRAYLGGV